MSRSVPDPAPRRRTLAFALLLASLCAAALFAGYLVWANTYPRGPLFDPIAELPEPLPAPAAEINARRITVAFADVQAWWKAHFGRELGRAYRPARLELFTRTTQSICVPGRATAGPFYCDAEAVVGFDILFSEALGRRLRREAETGTALIAAHLAGLHVQDQMGRSAVASPRPDRESAALVADCLAGVWARARTPRLGALEEGHYGRLIQIARNTAGDLARTGTAISPDLDPFRAHRITEREAAFQAGYRTGEPAICSVAGSLNASG